MQHVLVIEVTSQNSNSKIPITISVYSKQKINSHPLKYLNKRKIQIFKREIFGNHVRLVPFWNDTQ